jgi:hypothetical protein
MDYPSWLSKQFLSIVDKAEEHLLEKRDNKLNLIEEIN